MGFLSKFAAAWSKLQPPFTAWLRGAGDLLFPYGCAACGCEIEETDDVGLCATCRTAFDSPPEHRCPKCAARTATTFVEGDCPWCRSHDLRFERTVALGTYDGRLREAVLRLKRPGRETLAEALAELLARRWIKEPAAVGVACVVPVPAHWRRRVRRGGNGPDVIAAHLARRLHVPEQPRLLVRRRSTRPQAGLSPRQRQENVHNAFAVRGARRIAGRRVLLVDDVLTSGATCSEAARTLKRAGAAAVVIAVLARAQGETRRS